MRSTNNSSISSLEDQNRVMAQVLDQGGVSVSSLTAPPIEKSKLAKESRQKPRRRVPRRFPSPRQGPRRRPGSRATLDLPRGGCQEVGRSSEVVATDRPAVAKATGAGQGNVPGNVPQLEIDSGSESTEEAELSEEQLFTQQQQQWLWQQQFRMPLLQDFMNFNPNFPLGAGFMPPAWGFQPQMTGSERVRQARAYEISDDEGEVALPTAVTTAEPEITELVQDQLGEIKESDRVRPEVDQEVAQLLNKYLREASALAEMEKLAKQYPCVGNVELMRVQRLDEEVFQVVEQPYRNTDTALQNIQKAVMGAMSAIAPVLDLALARGRRKQDPQFTALGKEMMDGLQLLAFTQNAISGRRRELLKPQLAPVYAKVMTKSADPGYQNLRVLVSSTTKK